MHFACFVRNSESSDVIAVVAEVKTFPCAEDNHTNIELSATALASIRFFEFILLFVGTFLESLHDGVLVGFSFSERLLCIGAKNRFIRFRLCRDILLYVFNGLHILRRSDDEGLRHPRDEVFVCSPVGEMGFLIVFENGIRIER